MQYLQTHTLSMGCNIINKMIDILHNVLKYIIYSYVLPEVQLDGILDLVIMVYSIMPIQVTFINIYQYDHISFI